MARDAFSLIAELRRRRLGIACAESLTGGLLANAFVEVPGASAVFRGGAVCYATDTKASVLGVDARLLASRGPVDREVALGMALGALRLYRADVALATTGVAGPGSADGHAAGTVWVAVAGVLGQSARLLCIDGGRPDVRAGAVAGAIELLAVALDGQAPRSSAGE
ncbi:MAG: CinA family protein [Actinomycetaceae bacterium]|nr:CinA family protein [Actinomycetaceae bacterium]